jgi:hypothetical protein
VQTAVQTPVLSGWLQRGSDRGRSGPRQAARRSAHTGRASPAGFPIPNILQRDLDLLQMGRGLAKWGLGFARSGEDKRRGPQCKNTIPLRSFFYSNVKHALFSFC